MHFNRQAGEFFVIGLLLNIAAPYVLGWLNITSPFIANLF